MEIPRGSIAERVKGGGVRIRIKGSIDEGEIISTDERFDFKINKYFPIKFYLIKLDNGNQQEFLKEDFIYL